LDVDFYRSTIYIQTQRERRHVTISSLGVRKFHTTVDDIRRGRKNCSYFYITQPISPYSTVQNG